MTKKDFIALADAIRDHQYAASIGCINRTAFTADQIQALAGFCKDQNYNFMHDRWLDYIAGKCGKNGGKVAA